MGASAGAAYVVIREKHLVDAFLRVGAIGTASAVVPASIGVSEQLAFSRLREHGVLLEAAGSGGAYYLDQARWAAWRATRRRLAAALVILVILIGLAAWWLGGR